MKGHPRSQKLTFPGAYGDQLAARLDFPNRPVKAFALFAHCFTCSKDIFAASRVSAELALRGFAVLRFDFTGLGASEGEFASTNFSSNVADLLKAVDYLRQHYEAPKLLIGHSLGGAAVLVAAGDVPEVRAVATIGAPASADHVVKNFKAGIAQIEATGAAEVTLAGRKFTIRKQFLDDLARQAIETRVHELRKPLLIFHAPLDKIVGIDNAAEIFKAAVHPKSFISLDDADHLLSRKPDAVYVAEVLSAWASRYITDLAHHDEASSARPDREIVRSTETGYGDFQQEIHIGPHQFYADEPVDKGGLDSGPSPYDLLAAALASCTSMTLRLYANHKGYRIERIHVDVRHGRVHAEDCRSCGESETGLIDHFTRQITITGMDDPAILKRMAEIADKCPVHRTLSRKSLIETSIIN